MNILVSVPNSDTVIFNSVPEMFHARQNWDFLAAYVIFSHHIHRPSKLLEASRKHNSCIHQTCTVYACFNSEVKMKHIFDDSIMYTLALNSHVICYV